MYQRFDKNVIVPPEGVIGVISVKKTLRGQDIEHELKALYEAASLCRYTNDKNNLVRGPYVAIVAMNSAIEKQQKTAGEWIFSKIENVYNSDGIKESLFFNNTIGLITAFSNFSVFKARPLENGKKAKYVELDHKDNEEYISLQLLLTGLLSVYYDPTRNTISRPGFTSFESGRSHDITLGFIETKGL